MEEMISVICRTLVDFPDDVRVKEILTGGNSSIFKIFVKKEDVSKIIGKKGDTASAIRTIINAVASKENRRVQIEIIE